MTEEFLLLSLASLSVHFQLVQHTVPILLGHLFNLSKGKTHWNV